MAEANYDPIIRHKDGHLRAPFSHVGWYLSVQGVKPSTGERRAIENATQFLISLSIFARRLRGHVAAYKSDSWVDVPSHELFLDMQGLFLFAQQYLRQHPGQASVPPAMVLGDDEFDPTVSTSEPLFPLGTVIVTFSRASLDNLDYFLRAEPSNIALEPAALE